MHRYLLAFLLVGCAAEEAADEDGPRGGIGKADLYGTCAASDCGGKASTGNCFCDSECLGHGDCCANKPTTCEGGLIIASFNAGLAHGAVPYAEERLQPIIAELKDSPADVLCLQEVWTDDDAEAIRAGLAATFPHSFREKTENTVSSWLACGPTQWPSLYGMNSCVSEKCTPSGISAFECAADQCKTEWNALDDHCKLCLAANPLSPLSCAAWRAPMYGQDGRNGIMLVSRTPLENASYTPFETHVIKRGVIRADVAGYQVQCTHMTAQLDVVPYPTNGNFRSWADEHAAQITLMAKQAGRRRTIMLGDLNTGPATPGVDAELGANFPKLATAGYVDTWKTGQQCTYCQDNPLVCSKPEGCGGLSSRLDHALLRSFPEALSPTFERFGERAITIAGKPSRISDHYGLLVTMPY